MNGSRPTRREFLRFGGAIVLAPSVALPAGASADPSRIALVVGNDAYPGMALGNAVNDARAMATVLENAGFAVDLRTNADRASLADATKRLSEAAQRSEARLVFFYYAGHGAQLDWRNYLLPVDAKVNTAADLPAQCLDLASLLGGLSRAKGKTFVIVLDACRDNPFGGAYRPQQKGLSQFDAPPGSLLAFSTAPGSVAADASGSSGRNGLYTENLVRELSVRATKLEDALKRVRLAVRIASKGAQTPWESTSLENDVYLFPAAGKLGEAELEAQFERELETWNRIKASKRAEDWIAYLRDYPSGRFAEIAQSRLAYFLARDDAAHAPVPLSTVPVPEASPTIVVPAIPLGELPARSPPALEIVPGRPAPVLMRPSSNPQSAGTYPLDRRFSVGDFVVYLVSDPVYQGAAQRRRLAVTRVDLDADRVELNEGRVVFDSMGNPLSIQGMVYDPRVQAVPDEIQVGRKWTTRFTRARGGDEPLSVYIDYRVTARERIRLGAGELEAFRIDGEGFDRRSGQRHVHATWIVPGLNFALQSETRRYDGRSLRVLEAEHRELVACRQRIWRQV